MTAAELISGLQSDPMARLRWLVLSRFGCPPGGLDDRAMSNADCLLAAANMVLDKRGEAMGDGENPSFSPARFSELGGMTGA